MPTTIPYDPSLVLGNIVHAEVLQHMLELGQAQAPIDAAQDALNSLITVRRSLDMTVQELLNLSVPADDVLSEINVLNTDIAAAGKDYAKAWVDNIAKIKELKAKQVAVHADYESPIDYNKSKIIPMPLSADSLKMEAQYFSFESNDQSSDSRISDIKGFINGSVSSLGRKFSSQASSAVTSQISSQRQNHDISGTLVISVTCTHKNAQLFAPFALDVDKAIRVWNKIFTSTEDKIMVDNPASLQAILAKSGTQEEKSYNILSGATYGSCFIGMVHVLNDTSTTTSQSMSSVAASMQAQFSVNLLAANLSGGLGVSSSFSDDVKNMLSMQNVTSHVSLVTMGVIPTITSNMVKSAVQQFSNFDGASIMKNLAELANATSNEQTSLTDSANAARTGGQMVAMKSAQVTSVMAGVAPVDTAANKMLDINTMMTAFEDYVQKCIAGNIGVPINYYLKPISQSQLVEMFIGKYYPKQFLNIGGDDVSGSNPSPGANAGGTAPAQ